MSDHAHKFKRYDLPNGGYTEQCVVCGEYLPTAVDALQERYNALEAELAQTRSDRQREHELRVRYAGVTEAQAERIRKLDALINRAREVCRLFQDGAIADHRVTDRMLAIFGEPHG